MRLVIHNVDPGEATLDKSRVHQVAEPTELKNFPVAAFYPAKTRQLNLTFVWNHQPLSLAVQQ